MLTVNDYSHLSPEEAQKRYVHVANRIFTEQFHEDFFIKDPRPEQHLRYELQAFWQGTIQTMHGWTDPLGQALEKLESWFSAFLEWFWENVIRAGILTILHGFDYIWNGAYWWAKNAYDWIEKVWNYINTTLFSMISGLRAAVEALYAYLYNLPAQMGTIVANAVQNVSGWLASAITELLIPKFTEIFSAYKAFWDQMPYLIDRNWQETQSVSEKLDSVWDDITTQISGAFETLSHQVAALPQAIANAFSSAMEVLKAKLNELWNEVLVPFGRTLVEGVSAVGEQLGNIFFTVINSFHSTLEAIAPVTPDKAGNAATTLLKIAGVSAGGLLGMTAVWDLMHPFKDVIPGEIKAMIYDVTNFKLILGALAGALVTAAIAQPAKYSYNALLRPYIPHWGDIMELKSREVISDDELRKYMHYYGYDDVYLDYFSELANTPVRYFGLAAIARTGYFDEQFFREELNRSGYATRAKEVMLQMYQQTAMEAVKGYYGSVVIRRFREGIVDREGLENELKMLGYPENQRRQLITGAELYYDLDTVSDYVDAVRYSYRRGKITLDEMRAELASLGLRDDRIERITAIELARAKEDVGTTQEEEVRAYGRGTVIRRFREGLITPVELENELRMLGYTEQWIQRLKQAAILERDYDFAMTVLSYVKTAYRKRYIDDVRFIEILRAYGFTDTKIGLELSLIKLAYNIGLSEEEIGA